MQKRAFSFDEITKNSSSNLTIRDLIIEKYNSDKKKTQNERELEECTFHPFIYKIPREKEAYNSTNEEELSSNVTFEKPQNTSTNISYFAGRTITNTTMEKSSIYQNTTNNLKTESSLNMNHPTGCESEIITDADKNSNPNSHTNNMIKRLKRFCKKFKDEITNKHPNFVKEKNDQNLLDTMEKDVLNTFSSDDIPIDKICDMKDECKMESNLNKDAADKLKKKLGPSYNF